MKKFLIGLGLSIVSINIVWAAQSRESVLGMNIISRAEWGANESRRYASSFPGSSGYEPSRKTKIAIEHLKSAHPGYIDYREIKTENGHKLYRPFEYKKKRGIAIHHTASKLKDTNFETVKEHIRNTYYYHTKKKKRGDIGYNFLIDPEGRIYEGKAGGVDVIGAHSKFNNNQLVGISLIGNYENEKPTDKMIQAVVKLSAALSRYYNINPSKQVIVHKAQKDKPYIGDYKARALMGHKDSGWTLCPGKNVYALMSDIRSKVIKELHKTPKKEVIKKEAQAQTGSIKTGSVATGTNHLVIDVVMTEKNKNDLKKIYSIIKETVPLYDMKSFSDETKKLFKDYGVRITHSLAPRTTIGKNTTVKIAIYNKKTQKPYNGTLPIKIELRPVNDRVILSSSQIANANKTINIRGKKKGASIVALIVENQIIYAFPVIVQ